MKGAEYVVGIVLKVSIYTEGAVGQVSILGTALAILSFAKNCFAKCIEIGFITFITF